MPLPSPTCPRCATPFQAGHRFCAACGAALSPAGAAPAAARAVRGYTTRHLVLEVLTTRGALAGERKTVTVLFADVVDSMRLAAALDAEEWHRILDRVFEILAGAVHRFEGTINQFTGDGVMALFGAPVAHEDHARRACLAALAAMAEVDAYGDTLRARGLELRIRMGLNSGEVVVGKIGDDLRMDYTAQGHSVGLAARMEQLAAPGTALLTEHTARLVDGFFALADLGAHVVKGVADPVSVFELRAAGPLRTRLDVSGRRGLSRLIGREGELAWLDSILSRVIESSGQVVGVVGDAGVGKSRLCLEFIQRCRARGIAVHEVHCPAHGATLPWLAMRELLQSCLALGHNLGVEEVRRRVGEQLRALGPDFGGAIPLVLAVLGVADDSAPPESAPNAAGLAAFMRRFVRRQSRDAPIVLVLDDAHWIDRASDEVVREIGASVRDTRALLLANFRPDYRPAWIGGSHYQQLALSPLGEAASQELVRTLLGPDGSVGDLARRIREHTAGNPFFVEEVVHTLVAAGSLVGERGGYRLAATTDDLALPDTVQSLLAARIDRLDELAKRLLQAAAVIGREFDEPLLAEVSGLAPPDLERALGTLHGGEFLRLLSSSAGPEYAFKHPLMREVAYRSQLAEHRARLHAAVATAMEKLRTERLGEYASLIAQHWEASGRRSEAARWKRRAALRVANIKVTSRARRHPP